MVKRAAFMVPAFIFATLFALIGYDTLNAHSATAPAGKAALATATQSPVPAPSVTPQPNPEPSSQPAPPSPRITAASTRAGNTLTIPSIGFSGSIQNVGLTTGNAIDVPAHQVGYWTGSSRPGTPGAAFLDGHVDGVFAKLNRLEVGQTFSVKFEGQTYSYRVAHTETVQLAGIDMNRALSTYGGAVEGLNLMTCAGTYLPSLGTYDQRFVVYAVRA